MISSAEFWSASAGVLFAFGSACWWANPRRSLTVRSRPVDPSAVSPATTTAMRPPEALISWCRVRLRRRRVAAEQREAAIEVIGGFAAELRAGQPLRVALDRCVESVPTVVCPHTQGVSRLGGDVPRALVRDAQEQDLPILRSLAALWQVAEGSGAGLAAASERLAAAHLSGEAVRRELAAQLAGPRATARVLAVLPAIGLMLGTSLGASPVSWLVGTPWGWCVLSVGLLLEALGLVWTARLTRRVEVLL